MQEQVHCLALTDAGLRRVAVGVHAEELLVGRFGDVAGETAHHFSIESAGVLHRREAALEDGGGHSTSWLTPAGTPDRAALKLASYSREQPWTGMCLFRGRAIYALGVRGGVLMRPALNIRAIF